MQEIVEYLKNHVIGKTLVTEELVYHLEDNRLEGVYSDQIIFSNLLTSDLGIHFDLFVIAKELIYELNENHERMSTNRDFQGVSVFRYELAKRRSSGELTGTMRLLSTTVKNQTAEAVVYGVHHIKLEKDRLSWSEQQLLYRDQASNGDCYRAVAFDSAIRFYFEEGKLRFEYDGTCSDVDTHSFAKTPSNDIFPKFIAKER